MAKPHSEAVRRYNAKAYDRVSLMLPRGRKKDVVAYAEKHGTTIIGLINQLLMERMGVPEDEWKRK